MEAESLQESPLEQMAGAMIWLAGGVALAVLGIWYPVSVDRQFGPEVDTGLGFIYTYGIQVVIGATVAAGFALRRLYRGSQGLRAVSRAAVMSLGITLALATSSPIFALAYTAVRSLAWGLAHPDI